MKRTSLAAMLTLLAVLAATLAVAGCGGKTTSSSTSTSDERRHEHDGHRSAQALHQTGLLEHRPHPGFLGGRQGGGVRADLGRLRAAEHVARRVQRLHRRVGVLLGQDRRAFEVARRDRGLRRERSGMLLPQARARRPLRWRRSSSCARSSLRRCCSSWPAQSPEGSAGARSRESGTPDRRTCRRAGGRRTAVRPPGRTR